MFRLSCFVGRLRGKKVPHSVCAHTHTHPGTPTQPLFPPDSHCPVCLFPMLVPVFPRAVAIAATKALAQVDYAVANRVTDDIAGIVKWAYAHNQPWMSQYALHALQSFDSIGSALIAIVVWIVSHTS